MNKTPLFTVILPAYNAAETAAHMIRAVLDQSFSDFELILIDDGSEDETLSVMRSFADDERVRIIARENGGVSSARNAGIREAHGRYIIFADADDDLSKDCLQVFRELMDHADMGVCSYEAYYKNGERTVYSLKNEEISSSELIERTLRFRDLSSACWNKCFRKEIIDEHQILFDEKLGIGEDMLFILTYACYMQNALLTDRVHSLLYNIFDFCYAAICHCGYLQR